MMNKQEEFCLADFLTDSLSLHANITTPSRAMHTIMHKDPYLELTKQDVFDILGEKKFGKPQEEPKDVVGTPIQEFFRGAHVFITGGTGFLGKVLIEKLIRSIPHIGQIYLLIRAKRGMSSQERFEKLMSDKVFDRLRAERPYYLDRLTVVEGDISQPGLGLNPADLQMLVDRIHVVFHSAADVKFIEPLRVALESNVLGSRRVLELGKKITNLKSYVHVSTAYSHCVRRVIKEKNYQVNVNFQEILDYVDTHTDAEIEPETARIIQGWPNTYAFSKALCENMVVVEGKGLPISIFRPTVVANTFREPVRGWTDNINGPLGIITGTSHGILHCCLLATELILDVVPVDYTINCIIATAWKTGTCRDTDTVPFYNFASTPLNNTCWKAVVDFGRKLSDIWPYNRAIWYPSWFITENLYVNEFYHLFLHRIPGIFFDKLSEMVGEKPRLTKLYNFLHSLIQHTVIFSLGSWEFKIENMLNLWKTLDEKDKELFMFDLAGFDVFEFLIISKLGVRYYYLKETMESIPSAEKKNTRLWWLHKSVQLVFGLAVLKLMIMTARYIPI